MAKYKVNTMSLTKNDKQFFAEIAGLLYKARDAAYKTVNTMMIQTYWQIGRRIVEREQGGKIRANYGEYLIVNLSRYLTDILGKGFSEANLLNFRQFYLTFPEFSQFPTRCVGNLGWSHFRIIMRIENKKERNYYIKENIYA